MSKVAALVRLAQEAVDNEVEDEGRVFPTCKPKLPPNAPATQIVTCKPKHHAHGLRAEGKDTIKLADCWYGCNEDIALLLAPVGQADFSIKWSQTASLNLIVEDGKGWQALLSVYNGSPRFFQETPYFVLQNPRFRRGRHGSIVIRVDSPDDMWPVPLYDGTRPPIPHILSRLTAEHAPIDVKGMRQAGNQSFAQGQISRALRCWALALLYVEYDEPEFYKERALCRLNRAAAYLKTGRPGLAEIECKSLACEEFSLDVLDPLQQEKYWHRFYSAQYEQGVPSQKALPSLGQGPDRIRKEWTDRWLARESKTGALEYEWKDMLLAAKKGETLPLDEYPLSLRHDPDLSRSGLVDVAAVPGKGRGLLATRLIKARELIFLSKPIAFVAADSAYKDLITVNLTTEDITPPAQADLVRQIFANLVDKPALRLYLDTLGPGPYYRLPPVKAFRHRSPDYDPREENSLDAGRVEGIVTHNAFRVRCCSNVFEEENEDVQGPDSALYLHASMLNHSCLANCAYTFFGQTLVVRAMVDIEKGTELTISYTDPAANLIDRRKALRHHFGKGRNCRCALCLEDAEGRYEERKSLLEKALPLEKLDFEGARLLLENLQLTYKDEARPPDNPRIRAELYPVARQLARLAANPVQRCRLELNAAKMIDQTDDPDNAHNSLLCQPLVMSLLLIGSLTYEYGDKKGERTTEARSIHDKAAKYHHALYGPGLLKGRLGDWMAGEGIVWHGSVPFEEA